MTRYIRGVEWTDRSSDSRYPLQPLSSAKDTSGIFEIPNDLITAMYLTVPADLQIQPGNVFIGRLLYTGSLLRIEIVAEFISDINVLGVFEFPLQAAAQQIQDRGHATAVFSGATTYRDLRGRMSLGSLTNLTKQPQGDFLFTYDDAGFDPDCIRPQLRSLSAIEVETGGELLRLTGTVRLAAGLNTRLRVEVEAGEPVIYIDSLDTTDLNEKLACDYGDNPPIRRINGLGGNAHREVTVLGSRCLEVESVNAELRLRNRCSEPCVNCAEADTLRQAVIPFAQQVPTLTNLVNRLDMAVSQTRANLNYSGQTSTQPTTTQPPGA